MTYFLGANNAGTTLAFPITASQTTLTVATGTGALFPSPSGNNVLSLSLMDQASGLQREIVYATNRAEDVFTVLRGQENTVAKAYLAHDMIANLFTDGMFANIAQQPSDAIGGVSMVQVYPGNPNGHVAGNAGVTGVSAPSAVWDAPDFKWWICTTTGTASTAVWTFITGGPLSTLGIGALLYNDGHGNLAAVDQASASLYMTGYLL